MARESIQPLRINKMGSPTSPSKLPRPSTEKPTADEFTAREGSPVRSPRAIWQKEMMARGRFVPEGSVEREVVASKKSSIENLKKQSRVANNPLFARESRIIPQGSRSPTRKPEGPRKENSPAPIPERLVKKMEQTQPEFCNSPQKSSLTPKSRYTQQDMSKHMADLSIADDNSRAASPSQELRPRKSVTFQSAPPETHEYEQPTPEPSFVAESRESSCESDEVEEPSFERGATAEEEDSFDASLEDTTKTPVVLPGDWRHTSPGTARRDLVDDMDDVFESGSPPPTASPGKRQQNFANSRSESMDSEGSNRPLPPVPSMNQILKPTSSTSSLTAAAEAASNNQRALPSPPRPAAVSKAEILRMKNTGVSQEDRFNLMIARDEENHRNSLVPKASFENRSVKSDNLGDLPEFDKAPQISRESIMKKVKADLNRNAAPDEEDEEDQEPDSMYSAEEINYSELAKLDPDTPIPSRETSLQFKEIDSPMRDIKEEDDSVLDMDFVPEMSYDPEAYQAFMEKDRQLSVVDYGHHKSKTATPELAPSLMAKDRLITPQEEPVKQELSEKTSKPELSKKTSLPFLANFLGRSDLDFGLTDFTALNDAPVIPERKATIKTNGRLKARPSGTPADLETVIQAQRDAIANEDMPRLPAQYRRGSPEDSESLWSHPSTADSGESKNDSAVGNGKDLKLDIEMSSSDTSLGASYSLAREMERVIDAQEVRETDKKTQHDSGLTAGQKGYLMRQNTKMVVASQSGLGGSHNKAVMHGETDHSVPSHGNGEPPIVGSRQASTGTFIHTEPWNGRIRRKSQRNSSARSHMGGPAPPMPGHESALGTLEEGSMLSDGEEEVERGRLFVKVAGAKDLDMPFPRGEKLNFQLTLDNGLHCVTTGNLDLSKNATISQEFELVVQQDLDFQLTLTTNLPPPPKLDPTGSFSKGHKPKSPSKSMFSRLLSSPKKRAEQERRAQAEAEEYERRKAEEAEAQRHAAQAPAWNRMRDLVDNGTGSFARAYISLKYFEEQCYGRQLTTNVPLYNEWAIEKDMNIVSSVRSKRSNGYGVGMRDGVVRRPPYQIGNLEVQLLYIPRGKNFEESDMPKSMSSAMREMKEAERVSSVKHEGYLSQQGGDCPYWRRRFFRLASTKLTAYHEHTMQPRATINLTKAAKLIDDKTALVADPAASDANKSGSSKRRKSAFAEEDEGYQFVEEGFRLRFTNGETIDFYANTAAEKDAWMAALGRAIGKTPAAGKTAKWTDLVLAHETKTAAQASRTSRHIKQTPSAPEIQICPASSSMGSLEQDWARSAPSSPVKPSTTGSVLRKEVGRPTSMMEAPAPPAKDDEEEDRRLDLPPESRYLDSAELEGEGSESTTTPATGKRTEGRTRKAIKSMIF